MARARIEFSSLKPSTHKFSFIIPARPGCYPRVAIEALRRQGIPNAETEVLISYGLRPSVQRNEAAARATGEFLYFLDDDSEVDAANLALIPDLIERFGVPADQLVAGGAIALPHGTSDFQRSLYFALSSSLGMGPYRSRVRPLGEPRFSCERNLILANLIVSRRLFLESKGFDARLYPGEECQWLKRVAAAGVRPIYHPGLVCYRPHRPDTRAVFHMGYSYGAGRARHFFEGVRPLDILLAVPSGLVLVTALAVLGHVPSQAALLLYASVVILAAVAAVWGKHSWRQRIGHTFRTAGLLPVIHYGYGLGFLVGMTRKIVRWSHPETLADVHLHRVQPFALDLPGRYAIS